MESPDPQENLENLGLARLIRLRVKIIERVIGDEKNGGINENYFELLRKIHETIGEKTAEINDGISEIEAHAVGFEIRISKLLTDLLNHVHEEITHKKTGQGDSKFVSEALSLTQAIAEESKQLFEASREKLEATLAGSMVA